MGIIREPLDVDFVVDSRPLTEDEKKSISEFIKADKKRRTEKRMKFTKRKTEKTEDVS